MQMRPYTVTFDLANGARRALSVIAPGWYAAMDVPWQLYGADNVRRVSASPKSSAADVRRQQQQQVAIAMPATANEHRQQAQAQHIWHTRRITELLAQPTIAPAQQAQAVEAPATLKGRARARLRIAYRAGWHSGLKVGLMWGVLAGQATALVLITQQPTLAKAWAVLVALGSLL
jgi:hypothetical protein